MSNVYIYIYYIYLYIIYIIYIIYIYIYNSTENGLHIKDLRILLNRDLSKVIMVDNSAFVFGLNIDNGVPIIPFYDCKDDDELILLEEYLMSLRHRDIRKANKEAF